MPSLFTIEKVCIACNITLSQFFDSSFFNSEQLVQHYKIEEILNLLSTNEKELVLTYICGLLHVLPETKKEDKSNEL